MKIQKKNWGGGRRGRVEEGGGWGGCDLRISFWENSQKKILGGGGQGGGGRVGGVGSGWM